MIPIVERFQKLKPRTFAGLSDDLLLPSKWVQQMEKIFDFLGCTGEQRIACGGFQLEGDAEAWWKSTRPNLMALHPNLTWDQFKTAFYENYFPRNFREKKEAEFMSLVQGSKSVQEYQQKYEELHHFAPPYLRDDQGKASRFERGMRNTVGAIVLSYNLQRYTAVVQMAKSIEDR
ncbi:uncharacterized protein LOC122659140 [Telopea speciosissima]|uniref:uncharacterized protein LOC122659140 n=1 Tax=Telopea speciosissima TaxID=54955 RepID=UPI001CC73864|nr:uncharacterized protein LOC122659140 [Telopea speciosissima]